LGAARAARALGIRLAHVEAGLRSFDAQMPEEHNRREIDQLSDLLLITEPSARQNLLAEGISAENIRFPGNVMIDTLRWVLPQALSRPLLVQPPFFLCSFHRPSNVDTREGLHRITEVVRALCAQAPVLLPVHPRTAERLAFFGVKNEWEALPNLYLCGPLLYPDFVAHLAAAALVLTDSGGVQEESTALQTPCVTFRPNTERPVTVDTGTNVLLADLDAAKAGALAARALAGQWKPGQLPEGWDGRAAERMMQELYLLEKGRSNL
jgi:UDP-N-acetylglucosamine 2-epimerase (non-hydrolysing)